MAKKVKHSKYDKGPREIIVNTDPKSPASEQFRTIRTNILYSSVDKEVKTLTISSATPNAGKSTTTANVAAVFAQAGAKTLIIDGDLRKPTMHYTFELQNNIGLSTAIVGDVGQSEIIRETDIENLDIITSGPIPPNPAELLQSRKMGVLLKSLGDIYDMIIIDTPPLLSVTDAQIIAGKTDAAMLVTDSSNNNRDMLMKAKKHLDTVEANTIGVVLNNKKLSNKDNYYYYGGE